MLVDDLFFFMMCLEQQYCVGLAEVFGFDRSLSEIEPSAPLCLLRKHRRATVWPNLLFLSERSCFPKTVVSRTGSARAGHINDVSRQHL